MSGVFLGVAGRPAPRGPIAYQGESNVLTVAAPGSGKSRSVAIPNLIVYPGSMVVTDFKGELTTETSLWRAAVMGQSVRVIDPFRVIDDRLIPGGERGRIDPIDFIRKAQSPLMAAYGIAQSFIPPGGLKETHWAEGAQNYFAAMLLFVAFDPVIDEMAEIELEGEGGDSTVGRNMKTLWGFLSVPAREKAVLEVMVQSKDAFVCDQATPFRKASKANTEIAGIRNHLRVNLAKTLGDPAVLDTLSRSNIEFGALNKTPQTVYSVVPGYMASTMFRFNRLVNWIALGEIERSGLREYGATQAPTLFLMDEFATLGNFTTITEAMGRMRGYGAKFDLYVQGLSQLKELYRDGFNTVMANVGCLQYFGGTNDTFQAEYISQLCGTQTIVTIGAGTNSRPGEGGSNNFNTAGRRIFTPDEIMRLPMPKQIVKLAGNNPVVAEVIPTDLRDFPQYLEFMNCVRQGASPARAAVVARRVLPVRVEPAPVKLVAAPERRRRSVFGWFDDALAMVLGSDRD